MSPYVKRHGRHRDNTRHQVRLQIKSGFPFHCARTGAANQASLQVSNAIMQKVTIFQPIIPLCMRVFENGIDVAVDKRVRAARNFAKRHKKRIYLSRVTSHTVDMREIRVIGKSKGWFFEKSECIGCVPADIADKLLHTKMDDKVKVRLDMISIDDKNSITVRLYLFGPKEDFEKYSSIF